MQIVKAQLDKMGYRKSFVNVILSGRSIDISEKENAKNWKIMDKDKKEIQIIRVSCPVENTVKLYIDPDEIPAYVQYKNEDSIVITEGAF